MSAVLTDQHEARPDASSMLRTLALCDLVDSTALVERLGDREAAELIRKHDRLARTLADRHGGREIDKTDGFMMMFDRPIQAVAFALDYQRSLKQLNAAEKTELSARVGIHVGDVVVWDNSREDIAKGAKPVEVEGLVKPITSRLMSLALPGQILLSNIAYALAHRAQGELGEQLELVRWRTHGRYRFRGVPDPVPVFEVGEEGLAPLKAPPWSSKAHREVPFWRRPATVVIEALVVLALIAIPAVMFLRPDPAIAFASRDWVVVGSLNNLTGETVFDDALESALRIGLEQSRYVNVLPDLKVRDTITRMQRDPDTTEVNREVGSEVAIRDGARALILPTIAEIGGRVRITAEVIDPQTQTTVYSETADGIGKESILPSLDTINDRLRVRLGEALATVTENSMPLEKVATENLDALRAYSLGSKSYARGQFDEAMVLYKQALELDPEFASIYIRIGSIHASMVQTDKAIEAFEAALAKRERLTPRDTLYAEVMLAGLRAEPDVFAKWEALFSRYPDFFAGSGGYAYMSWRDANRFDSKTLAVAQASASPQNPGRLPALHLLGILNLGNERFADALSIFSDAESGGFAYTQYHAATEAAERKFDRANDTLARSPKFDPEKYLHAYATSAALAVAFAIDRGEFEAARAHLAEVQSALADQSVLHGVNEVIALTLAELTNSQPGSQKQPLGKALDRATGQRRNASAGSRSFLDSQILVLAYLAAHDGLPALSKSALAVLKAEKYAPYSMNNKLRLIAEAELARTSGDATQAVRILEALTQEAGEPVLAHVALLDAYVSAGEPRKALAEARWLASHRGRAYAEYAPGNVLTPFNVSQTNLALLRGAELALEANDRKAAANQLESFRNVWPAAGQSPELARRIASVQSALSP
ncbi:putative peptide modification system cyclase [Dokdonella sp.]|uniref:putative peptide modification system cyclase n=1 Tax=Dokdonella sp. TaxID=2291710 RepID=UPI003529C285